MPKNSKLNVLLLVVTLLVAGARVQTAFALTADEFFCDSSAQQRPSYYTHGARTCGNGTVENDAGTCLYRIGCIPLNEERRQGILEAFGLEKWSGMTNKQKVMAFKSEIANSLPTVLNCKALPDTVGPNKEIYHHCPTPEQCRRDAYSYPEDANQDTTEASSGDTFSIKKSSPSAGGAKP